MDQGLTTSERALMDALKFTYEDLLANRGGHLSEAQRQVLARRSVLMLGVTLSALAVFYVSFATFPEIPGAPLNPVTFALLPISLAVILFGSFELFSAFVKLQRNLVVVAKGAATIEVDPSPRKLFGKLTVGKFEMPIPKEQLAAFHAGDMYAVYYTAYPKQVMSAEFIGS
jgi:hypothetical protein